MAFEELKERYNLAVQQEKEEFMQRVNEMQATNRGDIPLRQIPIDDNSVPDQPAIITDATDYPFKIKVNVAAGTFKCSPGYLNNTMPTLSGTRLDHNPSPFGSYSTSGYQYFYLQVNITLYTTNSYVTSFSITSASVIVDSSSSKPDISTAPTGTFYIPIATAYNGQIVKPQALSSSLSIFADDDGTGTSTGRLYGLIK